MAVLDAAGQQAELDESNNALTTSPIAVTAYRPELTVTDLVLPARAQAGRPLAIRHTVRNVGPAPAGAFAVRFFLSTDDTLDAGDVLLGSRSLASLAAGLGSTATTTLTLPANTSVPGTYRVIARVDAFGQVAELNETNNTAVSSPLPITAYRPDITLSALSVPATAQAGRPLAITHTVRNIGPAPAGPFVVRFYLSTDDAPDAGDVLLGTRSLSALGAGASSAAITTVTVPVTTVIPASYRIIAVADALGQQLELDESNNVMASVPLALTAYRPEILITALGAPAVVQAGRPMVISHTVRNAGPAAAGPFVIRFFLSADDTLGAGDVLVGTRSLGGLGAGVSSPAALGVTLPATIAAGTYRIVAVADAAGQQAELDETNDVTLSPPLTVSR
jgi:subtilase family serine protease